MDLKLSDAAPTAEEREAVDALLGAPTSGWDGGVRDPVRDTHVAFGGHSARGERHMLVPALRAVQSRVGWISEGALNHVCVRLNVPPADAWGVATFYALFSTTPRPRMVTHVCDDIACRCLGAKEAIAHLEKTVGPEYHPPTGDHVDVGPFAWVRSPCLGFCDQGPAALVQHFGANAHDGLIGHFDAVTREAAKMEPIAPIDIEETGRKKPALPFHVGGRGPLTAPDRPP